jgi:GDP-mannose 4,6-dehydratase
LRALITGLGGFVASHLAEYLLTHTDWDIVGTMRWNDPLDNLAGIADRINRRDRVRIIHADLTDAWSMASAVQESMPNYVFHLAAQSYPQTSFTAAADTINTNVNGTLNLLEAVRQIHMVALTKVHICSSSEVYGKVPAARLPITEDCPFHPASPYAISKVGTDLLGQHYAQAYDMDVMVTRMFTHTGPRRGDVFAESSFAKQIAMIEAGLMEGPIKVGNLESLRTVADVRDAVSAYHALVTVNPVAGAVYNIGGAYSYTVGQILNTLIDLAGYTGGVAVDQERLRPIDADNQVPDCSKFKAQTGWEPVIPFEQTMLDLLEYWRARVKHSVVLQR